MYVRAAKGPTLTSVYDSFLMSTTKLSQDFLDFLIEANVSDLDGVGPTGTFAFMQEHGCLTLDILKDAQEADSAGAKMPTTTPAK